MAIRFRCPDCDQLFSIASRMAGENVDCPKCGTTLVVPEKEGSRRKQSGRQPLSAVPVAAGVEDDETFEFRKATSEFETMDLTPMVDVTFLLLIFFMVTASFSLQKTIEVPVPDPEQQGAAQSVQDMEDIEQESIIVDIDAQNVILVEEEPLAENTSVADVLREKMSATQQLELLIRVHDDALHESVVRVVDAGNEVGMQQIRLATLADDT